MCRSPGEEEECNRSADADKRKANDKIYSRIVRVMGMIGEQRRVE
jgi:hypothetical protein